jgi:hypothetical protein
MKILILIALCFLISCSSSEKKFKDYSSLGEPTDRDYIDHMAFTGSEYLANNETREIKLRVESIQYLDQIHERIVTNNERLLKNEFKPRYHVILDKIPFIFSLPEAQFYISSGLIQKYLKSEELFIAALTSEILKSDRNIYEKKILIPLGFYNTEKMILLTRLKPATKNQVNEWTYFVLKRAGFDPTAFLNWIQIQNRNSLDFSPYLGDVVGISKEEHLFKNFLSKQGASGAEKKIIEANSSKAFYKLLNNIASNQ